MDIRKRFIRSIFLVQQIKKYSALDQASTELLKETSEQYGYSARVIHKLLRLARTSADLAESVNVRYK